MEEKFLKELRFNELCKDALYHYLTPEGICPCCGEAILIKGCCCYNCGYDYRDKNGHC